MFARKPPPKCSIQRYSACVISRQMDQAQDAAAPAVQFLSTNATAASIASAIPICSITCFARLAGQIAVPASGREKLLEREHRHSRRRGGRAK